MKNGKHNQNMDNKLKSGEQHYILQVDVFKKNVSDQVFVKNDQDSQR